MAKAYITASGTFSIATDGSNITVEAIGGGGGGHGGAGAHINTGGGGAAYAVKASIAYTSNASITVVIGGGGAGGASSGAVGADGGDTDWDGGVVIAKGGQGGQAAAGGTGGAAASCTPSTGAFTGGAGGGIGADSRAGAGGGGAAGPNGNGQVGGVGGAGSDYNGAGGGGAGGGSSTAGGASTAGTGTSGAGGTAQDGTAGGAAVGGATVGNPGSHGSGGSGGGGSSSGGVNSGAGGAGGNGVEFDSTHGAGGGAGAGAGGAFDAGAGANGGLYGGGGSGAGWNTGTPAAGGNGGQGLIVVTYTPAPSDITLTPGAYDIAITPGTPSVDLSGTITLGPGASSITITPGTPTVALGGTITLAPGAGSIAITPGTPTVSLTIFLAPGPAQIHLTTQAPGVSLVRTVGTGNQLYIADTLFTWHESTFHISKQLSGTWIATFDLDYYGGTMPQIGDEVAMFWASTKRWGGIIQSVTEEGIPGSDGTRVTVEHSTLHIRCGGYTSLLDRLIVAQLFTLANYGITGIIFYEIFRTKLQQYGITKTGDAPNTFTDDLLFHYITVRECYNKLRELDPGWDYWIDDNKELHYENTDPAQGANAPFTIRNGDRNSDQMSCEITDVRFRNRQFALPSADLVSLRDDSRTGDGVSTSFSTDYALNFKPIVEVAGVKQIVTTLGDWIAGWQVYYIPGGYGVFFASPPGAVAVDIFYPNPFPVAAVAEDLTSIAAVGPYESIYQCKNVFDFPTAQADADTLLEVFSSTGFAKKVTLAYDSVGQSAWLTPGMRVDINRIFPTVSGIFTVEQVDSQEQQLKLWRHTVTLRDGLGEVTDAQVVRESQTSARVPIDAPPFRLTMELFTDIPGITNPGAMTGVISNSWMGPCDGVIQSYDIRFPIDPPTGADFQMDVLLNGVTIFPTGAANKVVVPDGDSTLQTFIEFATPNIPVAYGDQVTVNVLQVGSTNKGTNAVGHLNIKVPATGVQS